ncbi:hypothetical protein [Pseudomarimonas salicorniae]|uniref:Uncharacterized protein n=1 Tax=Pseudomarimonas salicorniae TaxID=2933270 RepID=A0ABT0GFB6_9GAMM|nr:hypothetical protein [Lysobacter sp. CAU 1642]MCK7592874.1 hypothetical protein [Lysobacter sp. CAU 1642]
MRCRFIAFSLGALFAVGAVAAPPYSGTVFLDPDIILASDPSAFAGLTPAGRGQRQMFDRRVNVFASFDAYLFQAAYSDGASVEVQVNPEFGSASDAQTVAGFYAHAIGQLPRALRERLRTVWIHKGDEAFGGGNDNLLIHTGSIAAQYLADGILEEVLLHEAVHTSLDPAHAAAPGWLAAQQADGDFISTYGRDFPGREDLAESFLPWFAARHRPERIDTTLRDNVARVMPARSAYFEGLNLDLRPTVTDAASNDQYWISGVGRFEGPTLIVDEAASTFGTEFGAGFDAARVRYADWGSLQIRFTSCSGAVLEYAATDPRFGSGGYPLSRLPSAAQRRCESQGFANVSGKDWIVGAWFGGDTRSGEGLLLEVLEGDVPFVAWFTYGAPR